MPQKKGAKTKEAERITKEYQMLKEALEGKTITIAKKADEKGSLYAAVSTKEILAALKKQKMPLPATLSEDLIEFSKPIKNLGIHQGTVHYREIAFPVSVEIAREN